MVRSVNRIRVLDSQTGGSLFGANWGYALWLLPALKMMILVTPQTQLSLLPSWQTIIYNFNMQQGVYALLQNKKPLTASEALFKQIGADNTARIEAIKTAVMQEGRSAFPANRISEQSLPASGFSSSDPVGGWSIFEEIDGMTILFFGWLAGFAVMGLITVGGHLRLQRQLQREKRKPSKEMRWLIEKLARKMGIKFQGKVLVSDRIQAPAVTGWLNPKLVLPFQFAGYYSQQEIAFMLSHELVHLQRRDYFFITWALVLKCVYWFNPLIYVAYRLFRLDQELACDQRVITSVPLNERKSYGLTILKTASQPEMMFENFQAGCFWFTFSQMKERIAMINHHRNSKGRSMLALLSMIVLGFTTLTFAAQKYVTDPTTGKVVSEPEYGGTITYVMGTDRTRPFDTYLSGSATVVAGGVVEKLGKLDWAMKRDEYHFLSGYVMPIHVIKGALAESWDISPDGLTYTFNIRKGVRWHDKPPMNGRELTAEDVEYNFHRMLGIGSGFTEPSPAIGELGQPQWESITATDRYTVAFKLKQPYLRAVNVITDWYNMAINPPEVIKEHGNMEDWRNLVGTGPFMLTDYVEGSLFTYIKNPDYWDYDEKFPGNRLPYIDELRVPVMPEESTYLAALRTGKVDYVGWAGGSQIASIDVIEKLKQTNPELVIYPFSEGNVNIFTPHVSKPPFDDIRVRWALQMALDLETINRTFYKGYGDTTPMGVIATDGFYIPFEEWTQEVKKAYTYDPEGAENLLDEAEYPRGSDGIRFKFVFKHEDGMDMSYTELIAAYWREIGVDMEIEIFNYTQRGEALRTKEFDMISTRTAGVADPITMVEMFNSKGLWNAVAANDPVYDALYEKALAVSTFEEQKPLAIEMDMHVIKKHWVIWGPDTPEFNVVQPWIKGYNGEGGLGGLMKMPIFARLWVDQDLKKEMGF